MDIAQKGFTPGQGGEDGYSADYPRPWMPLLTITAVPQLANVAVRCGRCSTSDIFSARPGRKIMTFTCRSCGAVNGTPGLIDYEFQCRN